MNPVVLLRKYASDEDSFKIVLAHSKKVTEIALRLAGKINKPVDTEFIKQAAMLHDIGRFRFPPGHKSAHHGVAGAEIMRAEGFPKIARVCERHLGAGISKAVAEKLGLPAKDYFPETVEEKLICYADRLTGNDKEIPFEEEKTRFEREYGEEAVRLLEHLRAEILDWMK